MPPPPSAPEPGRAFRWRLPAWSFLWAVLAVLHVTQAIWTSGGAAYPGNLADGRFNQLVLEHGYQSLRGRQHWYSPAQFYPVPNTLAYSDTHAGTLPLYVVLRGTGFSTERAWQGWFVIVAALNVAAAFRLFAALGIGGFVRGPLVFAGVAGSVTVWLAGTHMQMLPLFPLLLAWAELARWSEDRRASRLVAASGWFAWQFAAEPYLAFFGAAITVAISVVNLIAGWRAVAVAGRPVGTSAPRWTRARAALIAAGGWGLALAAASVYWQGLRAGYGRGAPDFNPYTLSPAVWFSPSPLLLFSPGRWLAGRLQSAETAMFAGALPWIAALAGLAIGVRQRHDAAGRRLLAIAGGTVLTMAFFTRWSDALPGAWLLAMKWLPALGAFRATDRIAGLVQLAMLAAAGLLFARWRVAEHGRWRWAPAALACAFALEGLSHHQPRVRLDVARARTEATIAAWRRAGDRPVLAFAFGQTNQPNAYFQLDAWSAALRLHRATLNGYSGGVPVSHHRFLWNPTPANARALAAKFAVPADQVSLVERFSATDDDALGIRHFTTQPTPRLAGFDLQPFAWEFYARLMPWTVGDTAMYPLTDGAEMSFHLPDTARQLEYRIGRRFHAQPDANDSDNVEVTWLVSSSMEAERLVSSERFSPATETMHDNLPLRTLSLPPGHDRVLRLRVDAPAGSSPWSPVYLGGLQVR